MRLTRWSHSCVSLEEDGRVLVLDPGGWSEARALDGAHGVLVTHEHGDHADLRKLRAAGLPVWAPRGADLDGLAFTPLDPEETTSIEGFEVHAVGGRHAPVVAGQEACRNLGYVVSAGGESVYHPGDALAEPGRPVTTLLVPMQASWLKTDEAIAFVRAVAPGLAVGIHDGQVNNRGRAAINQWLAAQGGAPYEWVSPGSSLGDRAVVPRVGQLRLVVEAEDFETAAVFYRDVLGLAVELDLESGGGARVLILTRAEPPSSCPTRPRSR
jgi:L-ascorbate metabolism protein UlaG (beta-lactamase superfamily)